MAAKPIPELSAKDIARFWAKVDVRGPDDCWPWLAGTDTDGYGRFHIGRDIFKAHRVSIALDGRDDIQLVTRHGCDNPPCCNPRHLGSGTPADNVRDKVKRGRCAAGDTHFSRTNPERLARGDANGSRTRPGSRMRGESNPKAKLTAADIPIIRADTRFQREIAAQYGVAQSIISLIKLGKTWKHVA